MNYTSVFLKNCRDHKKQGNSEKLPQPRGAKEDMTTESDVGPWMGSWNRKEYILGLKRKSKESMDFS